VHQDYIQRPPRRMFEAIGEAGTILVDLREPTLTGLAVGGAGVEMSTVLDFPRNQLFLGEMRHLLPCLARPEGPGLSIRDALRSLEIALAVKKSLDSGEVIELAAESS